MNSLLKIVILLLITFMSSISFVQEIETKEENVYTIVENMPEFPGGQEAMFTFISETITYPEEAKKNGIQGKVYVNFTVEKDGSIGDVKVIRGVHPLLDNEAMRVVESFPKWTPGTQRGKLVRVSYNLPLSFVLNKGNSQLEKKKKK